MALKKRTFRLQMEYWSEDETSFDTIKHYFITAAQETFAMGLLASGGAAKQPNVSIFTDSAASGSTEFNRDGEEI
jgi:hypothetical protein